MTMEGGYGVAAPTEHTDQKEVESMCLRNLFCGSDCNWILLIIIVLLLIDDGGCGCNNTYNTGNGCGGCGCGC